MTVFAPPEEGSAGSLANGGVVAAVGRGTNMIDERDQPVLEAYPGLVRPSESTKI